VLGITLTSRNHGGAENTPLAGFPFHALDRYANRLVKAGYAIAICEQTEDPKTAKGIVKRDIIEVITAGTATESSFLEEKTNNFIVGIFREGTRCGCAVCDLSTGQFELEEVAEEDLLRELVRIGTQE
jgi:DNA mismatch repair protein MutS